MDSPIATALGIDPDIFHWVVVPLAIFFARIVDVSINTLRTVLMLGGRRKLAPIFGFFEALIWLIAIGQIMKNLDSPMSYLAYAGGFATGIFVGMLLEEKLAFGKVIVRIITIHQAQDLIVRMRDAGYGLTIVNAEGGRGGKVNLIFSVVNRTDLPAIKRMIFNHDPETFFSVESVRFATEPSFSGDDSLDADIEIYNNKASSPPRR